jgi:hypothetical protein
MSACVYEVGHRPVRRNSAARRGRERRALAERRQNPGRQSPDPQDPKGKPIALALLAIPLTTASLSLAAALLGLFPAAPKPVAAAKPAPRPAVSLRRDAHSPVFASYESTHFTALVAKRREARSSALAARRERSSEHAAPQLAWTATLSVHVRVGTYGTKATFTVTSTGRINTTGPKDSR